MRRPSFTNSLRYIATTMVLLMAPSSPSDAAEVMILVGSDPSTLRVRLDHVRFVDPLTHPLINHRLQRGDIIPGNVAEFRISVTNVLNSDMRIWDFACPPNYAAKSAVMVMADTMTMDWGSTNQGWSREGWGNDQIHTGTMVWEQGACTLLRTGTWQPGRGLRWED